MHVAPTQVACIPVYELYDIVPHVQPKNRTVVFCPVDTGWVAEDIKSRLGNLSLNISDCPFEIASKIAVEIETHHVAITGMDGHRLGGLYLIPESKVTGMGQRRKTECLPDGTVYALYLIAGILERKPLPRKDIFWGRDKQLRRVGLDGLPSTRQFLPDKIEV